MKQLLLMSITLISMMGYAQKNPLLLPAKNKFGAPAYDKIKSEHYLPAFEIALNKHTEELNAIANSKALPTFENTVAAIDYSGELLRSVSSVFFNMYESNCNDELTEIMNQISPKLTEHNDNLYLDNRLFMRVKKVYENSKKLELTTEENRLLEKYYKTFVRNGAALNTTQKDELRNINKELGLATLKFGQNLLSESNSYRYFVTDIKKLDGLPPSIIDAAYEEAAQTGKKGQWLFTVQKSSFIPVLQYARNRELRKELLLAYTTRCNHDNEFDNKGVITKIVALRTRKANLLGYKTSADYYLDNTMAKTPEKAYQFLLDIWKPAVEKATNEAKQLQQLMNKDGINKKLEAWDWWYYSEKLRKDQFDINEDELRPYFKLENVRHGVFDLAYKLWGLRFKKLNNIPVYHKDVDVYEVVNEDGSLCGILYTDYYPRAGKRSGAWMEQTAQYKKDGINHRPIVYNVGNFSKPSADKPSLLNMDEVETLFHEFGHALHALLSQCTYPGISGTSVDHDFVELPSQIMENWCWEPAVMKTYAKHYLTDKAIPENLVEKIQKSAKFNQGFINTEVLAASILDLDYHMKPDTSTFDVNDFEKQSMTRLGLIPEIIVRYRSTYFNHIFNGEYCAGYYGYTWAAVLDADAYSAFQQTGNIFDKKTAALYRKYILEKGGSDDPMKLYKQFRGAEPNPKALLLKRGLK